MEDPKVRQLFDEIRRKTKAGKISWKPTANESEFLAVLPGGLALVISLTSELVSWETVTYRALVLKSEDLDELLRVTGGGETVGAQEFDELYELARRNALGVDARVDKLLLDLARM
jgi:hypothetical protein